VNRSLREKSQRQSLDFHILSRIPLEIGNYLGPIAIQGKENGREESYTGEQAGGDYT
jgi:hypothetical protein